MNGRAMVRVWDPLVRVFHWGLAAAFTVAFLSGEGGIALHRAAGYAVGGLVAFRLLWGLIGPRHARFRRFVRPPAQVLAYLKDMVAGRERRYLGHNPAGGAMIVAMLFSLAVVVGTGLAMDAGPAPQLRADGGSPLSLLVAPAHADEDDHNGGARGPGGEAFKAVHAVFSNLMLILVAAHILGVVLASRRHGENLVRAMVTGDKRAPAGDDVA